MASQQQKASVLSKVQINDKDSSELKGISELEKSCHREKYLYTFYWWGEQAKIPEPYPVSFEIKIKQIEIGGKHFLALSGSFLFFPSCDATNTEM